MWQSSGCWRSELVLDRLIVIPRPDPEVPFVPEEAANLMVFPIIGNGVFIPCRVSNPYSHVTLNGVPGGQEIPALYDNKMGFFSNMPVGQYRCETTAADGRTVHSETYTVENLKGEFDVCLYFFSFFPTSIMELVCKY